MQDLAESDAARLKDAPGRGRTAQGVWGVLETKGSWGLFVGDTFPNQSKDS